MGKFREKIYKFASGRHGIDQLYYFNLVVILLLMITDFVLQIVLKEGTAKTIIGLSLSTLTIVVFIWTIFRAMSRNRFKRRMENAAFLKMLRTIKRIVSFNTSKKTKSGNRDDAMYIFRDCTKCGSTLRLPRKVGKNKVKCPRCSHSFSVKAKAYKSK